jgi:hypothetical protein
MNTRIKVVVTQNFIALLQMTDIDTNTIGTEAMPLAEAVPGKTGRLPPVVLTTTTNLSQLQKQLKGLVKVNFEFCKTRNGTRVITKAMADFSAVSVHFKNNSLAYFTFCPKSKKPIKTVICHLQRNTPAEGISDRLVSLGFDVTSVKQMSATCWLPAEGTATINLPLVPHILA